MSQLW